MKRPVYWAISGMAWAAVLGLTAREPAAGSGWRLAFVAASLVGCVWLWAALRAWSPRARDVLVVAVALRAFVFPLEPTLSDDGYRYVWDGMLQAQEDLSPYRYRPSDPALSDLHGDVVYQRMNSPNYYSVYPPVSQAVFSLAGLAYEQGWKRSWWIVKSLVLLAELVGIVLLIRVVGSAPAALYAWHPLAVVEVAGQAHTEGLLVGALGVLLWSVSRRPALGGAAIAVAGWVKLYPFALAVLFARRFQRQGVVVAIVVACLLALPFAAWESVSHVLESVRLYAGTFDFYSAPYRILKHALYGTTVDPGAMAAGILSLGWLGWTAAVVVTNDGSSSRMLWSISAVISAYAVTSTTVHPWHLLGLLFVLPLLQNQSAVLWLTAIAPVTYATYVYAQSHSFALWAGWGGALAIWTAQKPGLTAVLRARGRKKWDRLRTFAPALAPGARVLDLGAGEGYVGDAAALDLGLAVTGVDVVSYGPGERCIDVYDGETLPYDDATFDATLVVFVLHHAERPVAVVREAVRVSAGPVLILETVWIRPWQKPWLEALDRIANRLRSLAAIDEEPLDIRSDAEWRALFEREGLRLDEAVVTGGLHPQALYVLAGHGAAASNTSDTDFVRPSSHIASA